MHRLLAWSRCVAFTRMVRRAAQAGELDLDGLKRLTLSGMTKARNACNPEDAEECACFDYGLKLGTDHMDGILESSLVVIPFAAAETAAVALPGGGASADLAGQIAAAVAAAMAKKKRGRDGPKEGKGRKTPRLDSVSDRSYKSVSYKKTLGGNDSHPLQCGNRAHKKGDACWQSHAHMK